MSPARTGRLGGTVAAIATLLLAWALVGLAGPAHASGTPAAGKATLTAEKTTGLNPAGDVVKLVGKGFTPGVRLFILPCDPAQGAGRACDMGSFGGPTEADATGSFSTDVKVAAKFGTVDCLKTRCAIATSNSANGKDRTQEVYLPIGFAGEAPGLPASPGPATAAPQAGAPGAGGAPQSSAAAPATSPAASPGADTAKTSAQDEDDDSGNTGLIIGLIAAVVVVLVAVGVVVKRRRPSA
ncbi:neocarzinostatin apoprotein domain-containing protein [Embleya sp. NBC_00888]|uniref:neocarzinostatin apoprotein domain-containing protein n=1 Tax=Embleya sp. NBC_00888 TaxID=2975960 RepID=UPI00386D3EC9|nr:neocarzinostatin apoprotein domain-containing protein [Embleya sp. NBC_00888]